MFLHPRQRRKRRVVEVVSELIIDLVADHEQIALLNDVCHRLQFFPCIRRAGRIARIVNHQRLDPLAASTLNLLRGELKAVGHVRFQCHDSAAGKFNNGAVRNVARLGNKDFVAGVDDRAHGEVKPFAHPDGDQGFLLGIIAEAEAVAKKPSDRAAQLRHALVRRIGRVALLEREDRLLTDMPRRDKVRLADAERNHILHAEHQVKKGTDPRRCHLLHFF